jgi:hypothetical protein
MGIAEGIDMAVRERPLAVVFVSYSDYVATETPALIKSFNVTPIAEGVVQAAKRIIAADIPVYRRACACTLGAGAQTWRQTIIQVDDWRPCYI